MTLYSLLAIALHVLALINLFAVAAFVTAVRWGW